MMRNGHMFCKRVCGVQLRQTTRHLYSSSSESVHNNTNSTVEQKTRTSNLKQLVSKLKAKSLDKYLIPDCHIVHSDANILALNKPQSLSVFGVSQGEANVSSADQTIVGILPHLAKDMRCPNLDVCLSLKSYYSGLVLLSKTAKAKASFEKLISKNKYRRSLYLSYLAITVGQPHCKHGVPLSILVAPEYVHGLEMTVIKEKDSKRAREQGRLLRVPFAVDVIDSNPDVGAALVRISVNREKYGVIEAVLSEQLSPVLGDKFYAPRTFTVMGVPFSASHSPHITPPGSQRLPQRLTDCLDSDSDVPKDYHSRLFLHRHQVHLREFPYHQADPLTLTAPLPSHFLATLKCLGLADNIQDL